MAAHKCVAVVFMSLLLLYVVKYQSNSTITGMESGSFQVSKNLCVPRAILPICYGLCVRRYAVYQVKYFYR